MSLADRIKERESELFKQNDLDKKEIEEILNKSLSINKTFVERIKSFIEDFKLIAKDKNIDENLVTFDGMLFLKDLCEINFSICFDDFDKINLTISPLFFISLESCNNKPIAENLIPNILNFSKNIDGFLKKNNLDYGYIALGKERPILESLEIKRFVSSKEFKEIVDNQEKLFNDNIDLFIEDLENFIVKNIYEKNNLVISDKKL